MISHLLQQHGIATTSISLIREHTEWIKPPRALWVPFPLGRPFGIADDPDFQTDVLRSVLGLLETATAATIEDYSHEAPDGGGDGVWACSIALPEPQTSDLERALRAEVDVLTPSYDEARRHRGRTTVGMSGATPEEIDDVVSFIVAIAEGSGFSEIPASASGPNWTHKMPLLVRFVIEDLRAFYQEAVTSQPGSGAPSQHDMHNWLFAETALGEAIRRVGQQITAAGEPRLMPMRGFIVPEGFWEGDTSWGLPKEGRSNLIRIRNASAYLVGDEA